jgi:tyrosyl-tRNA synthetase
MTENNDDLLEKEVQGQLKYLRRGVTEIVPEGEFIAMLRQSLKTKIPLRVKCGIDPTSPDVHLGHTVPCRKMRHFQNLGHLGVVIIGDYTASIGDPTGRNESRPPLPLEQIAQNAKRYMEQMYTILLQEKTEVHFQSQWFNQVTLRDVIKWASQTTVAKLLSHETFRLRLEAGSSLSLNEFFYPVLQGVDSVYVKADVELGGTDQKFNVLMGRDYQKWENQRPQAAILLPIITGICGTQKMSKSLGNYIGILDEPFQKFGKVMSIPDHLMAEYFELLTEIPMEKLDDISRGLKEQTLHPNQVKKDLASAIVEFFHPGQGEKMRIQFEDVFKNKNVPDKVDEFKFNPGISLCSLLFETGALSSKGEARRMVRQNAVSIEGEKLLDPEAVLDESYRGKILKIGKRKFIKLV